MAEEMMEKPQLEEQVKEKPQEKKSASPDIPDFLALLEKYSINNPEQLNKKLVASQESGRLANLLGNANQKIQSLEETMKRMIEKQERQQQRDDWDQPQQQPIDLEAAIARALDKQLTARESRQMQAQQAAWSTYQAIRSDPDFHMVAEAWAEKERDPQFLLKVQNGQADLTREYQELVRSQYKLYLKQAADAIKTLTGGVQAPMVHVEDSSKASAGTVEATPEYKKKLKEMKERVDKGGRLSEDEEIAALMSVLSGQ